MNIDIGMEWAARVKSLQHEEPAAGVRSELSTVGRLRAVHIDLLCEAAAKLGDNG
jgi:hypothetical protein